MKKSAQGIVRWTRGRGNTPDANYYGAAQFNYSIKAVTGRKRAANDGEWFCERWAA